MNLNVCEWEAVDANFSAPPTHPCREVGQGHLAKGARNLLICMAGRPDEVRMLLRRRRSFRQGRWPQVRKVENYWLTDLYLSLREPLLLHAHAMSAS